MADDRADPIMDNYDPDGEAHMFGIINGDILYVPTGQEEDDISSYLNLDGEDEGRRQQDDAEQNVDKRRSSNGSSNHLRRRGIYIYIEPLVIQTN